MKQHLCITAAVVAAALAPVAGAAVYVDATSDIHTSGTNPILDIVDVTVTNDATNLYVSVELVGNIQTTNWGKYMIGIDSVAGGTSTGNGWARPINMTSMDHWVGSWVNDGGGTGLYAWDGDSWEGAAGVSQVINANTLDWTISLAALGLASGGTLNFDVYTSGGGNGDTAIDASSNLSQTSPDWGTAYTSTSPNISSYNVVVPEPAGMALVGGLGLLGMIRRRRGK